GGSISIESSQSAISANDVLAITGADITVISDMDAIHCENEDLTLGNIYIESGTFDLNCAGDGVSATGELTIMDGDFTVRTAGGGADASMKGLKSDGDLIIYGGYFSLETTEDSIHSDSCVTINGGVFEIYSEDDAVHADGMLTINGGEFDIEAWEGLEATYILINDGVINIYGKDDGINAANKSSDYEVAVEINGGELTIDMEAGDTDGIDSNGNIYINGGTISVNGQSTIDYDGYAEYTGGTIIINGQTVDSIPNQMMGGGFGGGPGGRR
ncbi:MAG: carbohydrate-binding domain-containing protein, partial [Lachnospiraceae bacterium]|nr:carbohydrate-binding domain-containing protein [Lachnospiraceae bacterium]